jgi:hypothetical protein
MLPSEYEMELLAKGRMRDALRKAEQHRLIQTTRGPAEPLEWRLAVTLALKSLLATFALLRVEDPPRRSLSRTPGLGCESCQQGACGT